MELQKKIDNAIKLIQHSVKDDIVEVCYSGGKDSEVILELTKMAGVKYRAIYKNTTIDPPGTIKHCKEMGVEVLQPNKSFFELIESNGPATRRARFCCDKLKEYKVLDKAIQGIRRNESTARSQRYSEDDPVICRIYGNKCNHVSVILPILGWTQKDISEFIKLRGIKCHPLYYDEEGNFHAERRLGCYACPLQSDAGKADFLANPKFFRQYVRHAKIWWDTHPRIKSRKKFGTIYGLIAHNIFYKKYIDWYFATYTLFGDTDWKVVLERYFNIELP